MFKSFSRSTRGALFACAASLTFIAPANAQSADALAGFVGDILIQSGIPQIDGFLPTVYEVPATEPLPIDGIYKVSTIGKRIRIERGRAYAVDGWNFALFMRIQPNMVTAMNFVQTGPNTFEADDLPLMGRATMTLQSNGVLDVQTRGGTPYDYQLIPDSGLRGFPPQQPGEPYPIGVWPPTPPQHAQPAPEPPPSGSPPVQPPPQTIPPPTSPAPPPGPAPQGREHYDESDPNCEVEAYSPSTDKFTCMD